MTIRKDDAEAAWLGLSNRIGRLESEVNNVDRYYDLELEDLQDRIDSLETMLGLFAVSLLTTLVIYFLDHLFDLDRLSAGVSGVIVWLTSAGLLLVERMRRDKRRWVTRDAKR